MDTQANGLSRSSNDTSKTARQLHQDIEQSVGSQGGRAVWDLMKRHPFASVVVVGAAGVAAATAIGVAELAFGSAVAFAAYKVLREGEPPVKAFEEIEHAVGV